MPVALTTYSIKFPDGHVQEFTGPDTMSDAAIYQRAEQERAISSGAIPTSFLSGATRQMGKEKAANTALITGAGLLTGGAAPAVGTAMIAAAPTLARGVQYATEKFSGQEPTPISMRDIAESAAGVAGAYGPGLIANSGALSRLPGNTLPQWAVKESGGAIGKVMDKLSPQSMMKTIGDVGTGAGELAGDATAAAARVGTGVSKSDLDLFKGLVDQGMSRSAALKVISNGNAGMMAELSRLTSMSPMQVIGRRVASTVGGAAPAAAMAASPDKVGNTSSSADLLARQQREAVQSRLTQRLRTR